MPEYSKWFFDKITPELIQIHSIGRVLYQGKSQFQSMEVMELGSFGRCLILDGKIQCSEQDEFIYHEALVQPAMVLHPQAETVFIAGGGEGATLREVLGYPSVKRAVMVDIDKEVIEVCQRLLPSLHQGSFQDSRLKLYHRDAREYLATTDERFDVIIIDITDPLQGGPAYLLYTREFYEIVKSKLTPKGVISVQAEPASWGNLASFTAIVRTLSSVFSIVCPYRAEVPSFGSSWGFVLASQELDPRELPPAEVDRRLTKKNTRKLGFYDGKTHQWLFAIPKHLRKAIESETKIISDKDPLFAP